MQEWVTDAKAWLTDQYSGLYSHLTISEFVDFRFVTDRSILQESSEQDAQGLVIEDSEIGCLVFLIKFSKVSFEKQINEAINLRSRLLRESNYSGNKEIGSGEDEFGSWRVRLVWIGASADFAVWQENIIGLRKGSGMADELSFDYIKVDDGDIRKPLNADGLPFLLLATRKLLSQSKREAERWLTANDLVMESMKRFPDKFESKLEVSIAKELSELAFKSSSIDKRSYPDSPRTFDKMRIENFRNLEAVEISRTLQGIPAQEAIVVFGPNGTGKSSLIEAVSLANFGTSYQFLKYEADKDTQRTIESYLDQYISPIGKEGSTPKIYWNEEKIYEGKESLTPNSGSFDGVVLSQEESIQFSEMSSDKLATKVLVGYSTIADSLSDWLSTSYQNANIRKQEFTKKHDIRGSITRTETIYNRLALSLLTSRYKVATPEFKSWLRSISNLGFHPSAEAKSLLTRWQEIESIDRDKLADSMTKLAILGAEEEQISKNISESFNKMNSICVRSSEFHSSIMEFFNPLVSQKDSVLRDLRTWRQSLTSTPEETSATDDFSESIELEIENLLVKRSSIEKSNAQLQERLGILESTIDFISKSWAEDKDEICPVCESNVSDRSGIASITKKLKNLVEKDISSLGSEFATVQETLIELKTQLGTAEKSESSLPKIREAELRDILSPFVSSEKSIEQILTNLPNSFQLEQEISSILTYPALPSKYESIETESNKLSREYKKLTADADLALAAPQAINSVRKEFSSQLEYILQNHLPDTLGKVWNEISLTLTTAPWLLPGKAKFSIEKNAQALKIQVGDTDRSAKYIFNVAEKHILGLSWFFTYYLAEKRFMEAWIALDDPAQEMDQPTYRELVRFFETLLRLFRKKSKPLTLLLTLHQEGRALDATRGTAGIMYTLGWKKNQKDGSDSPSISRLKLLAPGYHPLKPEVIFSNDK